MDNGTQTGTAPDQGTPEVVASAGLTPPAPSTTSLPAASSSAPSTPGDAYNTVIGGLGGGAAAPGGKPTTTKGDLARSIVAGAIMGMIGGLGHHGPAHAGEAIQGGFAAEQGMEDKQRDLQKQKTDQDYMNKVRGLDLNLKQLQLQKQQSDMDEEAHTKTVDLYAQQLSDAIEDNPTAVIAQHISEADASDVKKYPSSALRIPDGVVPKPGGGFQQTFTIMDGNTQVPISDWSDKAKDWSIPGADKIPAGGSVSALTSGHYTHAVATLEATQSELNDEAAKLGTTPVDLKAEMKKNPGLLSAINQFQKSSWASTNPDEQVAAMKADKRAAPYAPYIEQLFGGAQALKNLNGLRTMDDAKAQQVVDAPEGQYPKALVDSAKTRVANSEKRAQEVKDTEEQHKQDIDLPAKEKDQKFQADQKALDRAAQITTEQGKAAAANIEKLDSAYQDTVRQANNIRQGVSAAQNKDALASAILPLEAALFVTTANGIKRINTTEIGSIALAGSVRDRIEAWVNGKISGDVVPDDIKKGMLSMVDTYQKNAYNRYEQGVASTTQRSKGSVAPVGFDGSVGGAGAPASGGSFDWGKAPVVKP